MGANCVRLRYRVNAMRSLASLLSLLGLLVAGSTLSAAANAAAVSLTVDRYTPGRYGGSYGVGPNAASVTTSFYSNGQALLLHARAFDIDSYDEVHITLNGRRLGRLPQTANRKLSTPNIWIIPESLQRSGKNKIRFVQRENDADWGIQDLGLFEMGGPQSSFGDWRNKTGVRARTGATLNLPERNVEAQLGLRFFDIDNPNEASLSVGGLGATTVSNTPNNGWGASVIIDVPQHIDTINIKNVAPTGSGSTWGFRVEGFYNSFDYSAIDGLQYLTSREWDTAAVRRVLHTFAFGSRATETQIRRWSGMRPQHAITEILNFNEHNLKLSPTTSRDRDAVQDQPGTLRALGRYWSRGSRANPVPPSNRDLFRSSWSLGYVWAQMAAARGLNPFRHKIGLWETNYHMAVNMNAGVGGHQIINYYDNILELHKRDVPYSRVLSAAAASAAIATQYNHGDSIWIRDESYCECNEDFSREYHQLFFGILGKSDTRYHENVTIKNMSRLLTDIRVRWNDRARRLDSIPRFGTEFHHVAPLEIQNLVVNGANARDKLSELSNYSIENSESLDNLPVMIISGLADDNLTPEKTQALRTAWASMRPKSLLRFLRAYAISTTFHSADRYKYWSSIDRSIIFANQYYASNEELYHDPYSLNNYTQQQVEVFRPIHNVFGNQTGREAARSPEIVRQAINRSTENLWYYTRDSLDANQHRVAKNWTAQIPKSRNGRYRVKDVAEWLWNRIVGDDLKNFDDVARAHVYALLGHRHDLLLALDENDINRVIRARDFENDGNLRNIVARLERYNLGLDSNRRSDREQAHYRIGRAVAFIAATPFSFAQEGL